MGGWMDGWAAPLKVSDPCWPWSPRRILAEATTVSAEQQETSRGTAASRMGTGMELWCSGELR